MTRALTMATLIALGAPAAPAGAESARALLKQGNQLFASGEYHKAREVFERAYRLNQDAVFLRGLANALVKVRWHADALKRFREYLERFPKAKDRAQIEQMVQVLDVVAHTRLTVRTKPLGARVYIDSEVGGQVGETPFAGTIEPGTHVVILKKNGFRDVARSVTVKPKQRVSLRVPLEVTLKVSSIPTGATVHLDAEGADPLGQTPLETGLPVGRRTVFVKRPGLSTYKKTLEVSGPGEVVLEARLARAVPVRSTPAGARVLVDGKPLEGRTPLTAQLTPGRHRIELRLKGLKPHRDEVEVTTTSPGAITARLGGGALLSMRSEPGGATLLLDGKIALGRTPLADVPVPAGRARLGLRHPDRRAWDSALELGAGERLSARVKLGRRSWPVWTLLAVAGVAGLVGMITGVAALDRDKELSNIVVEERDANDRPTGRLAVGACTADGQPIFANMVDTTGGGSANDLCGLGLHHATTALLSTAGISAASALLYYLLFVRPSVTVER